MAKKHIFSRVSAWMSDKQIPITNVIRIRYHLEYSYKSDKDALSNDCSHIFDLEMPLLRMVEIFKNEVTVKWQNGRLRKMMESEVTKLYPRGAIIKYKDVYPGAGVRVVKMTEDDLMKKAAMDDDYKQKLLKMLQDM